MKPEDLFARINARKESAKRHYPFMQPILEQLAIAWASGRQPNSNDDKNNRRNRYTWIPVLHSDALMLLLWFGRSHYLHEILGQDTSLRGYFYDNDVDDRLVRVTLGVGSLEGKLLRLSIDDDTGLFFAPQRTDIDIEDVESLQSVVNQMVEMISDNAP